MSPIDQILAKLAQAVQRGQYEEFETDVLEIKSVPADGAQWHELHKSVNAFLNSTRFIVRFVMPLTGC
jgi:hypothetical protein